MQRPLGYLVGCRGRSRSVQYLGKSTERQNQYVSLSLDQNNSHHVYEIGNDNFALRDLMLKDT